MVPPLTFAEFVERRRCLCGYTRHLFDSRTRTHALLTSGSLCQHKTAQLHPHTVNLQQLASHRQRNATRELFSGVAAPGRRRLCIEIEGQKGKIEERMHRRHLVPIVVGNTYFASQAPKRVFDRTFASGRHFDCALEKTACSETTVTIYLVPGPPSLRHGQLLPIVLRYILRMSALGIHSTVNSHTRAHGLFIWRSLCQRTAQQQFNCIHIVETTSKDGTKDIWERISSLTS